MKHMLIRPEDCLHPLNAREAGTDCNAADDGTRSVWIVCLKCGWVEEA